jgi:hypothetical protein
LSSIWALHQILWPDLAHNLIIGMNLFLIVGTLLCSQAHFWLGHYCFGMQQGLWDFKLSCIAHQWFFLHSTGCFEREKKGQGKIQVTTHSFIDFCLFLYHLVGPYQSCTPFWLWFLSDAALDGKLGWEIVTPTIGCSAHNRKYFEQLTEYGNKQKVKSGNPRSQLEEDIKFPSSYLGSAPKMGLGVTWMDPIRGCHLTCFWWPCSQFWV